MTTDFFHQAKTYHQSGALLEAESLYRQVLADEPESFKACNNLGSVLEDQGRFAEAIEFYQRGVTLAPKCFLLHYNLGHALQRLGELGRALASYMNALNLDPDSLETHFNIGNLLFDQGRYSSAVEAYRRAVHCDPRCKEAHSNLGSALYELREFEEAAEQYRQALRIDDTTAIEHANLAKCLNALNRHDDAIAAYHRSLELDPEVSATYANLVLVLQGLGRDYEAEQVFEAWQRHLPDDPVATHLWASHSGVDVPPRASDDYIQTMFDEFSSDFDAVLSMLQYRGPQLLVDKIRQHVGAVSGDLTILDAGCGTGLCGPLLREHASVLHGVDLSLGMLEKARFRGAYDDLFHDELGRFLRDNVGCFDVILAADTLIYFGELTEILADAKAALRDNGLLVFNLECLHAPEGHDFVLNRHGRYSHALEYVGLQVQRAGFQILELAEDVVRHEAAQYVECHIITAQA